VSLRGGRPQQATVKSHRFHGLQLSPDGRTMAAVLTRSLTGKEEQVALLNAANAQLIAVLGDGRPERFAFSPDGKLLASTDLGYKVKLWDVTARAARPTNAEHAAIALAFGDNGRVLVAVDSQRLYQYDVETGQLKGEVDLGRGHSGEVFGVAVSPVAPLFASVGDHGEALLRDLADGRLRARLPAQGGPLVAAAFSPDGKRLATACLDRTVKLWEVGELPPPGETTAKPAPPGPARPQPGEAGPPRLSEYAAFPCERQGSRGYLRFSRDGNRVAIGYEKVQVWDLAAKAPILPAAGKPEVSWGSDSSSCLAPDGGTVLHGGSDNLAAYDVATGTLHPLRLDGPCYGHVAFSPDGRFVAVGQHVKEKEGKVLTLYDLKTYTEKTAFTAFDASVQTVGYTPDGSELFAFLTDREGTHLLRLDPDTLKQRADLGKADRYDRSSLVFSPDSKLVGFYAERPKNASSSDPTGLSLWDIAAGRVRTAVRSTGDTTSFVADGAIVASGSYDQVTLSDAQTGQERKRIRLLDDMKKESGHQGDSSYGPGSYDLAFSANGRWVATGATSGHVYFWSLPGGNLAGKVKAHTGGVEGLAFSPDGRFLVTFGEEKKLKVWTLEGAAPPGR
jgi:WD40 repeat protein